PALASTWILALRQSRHLAGGTPGCLQSLASPAAFDAFWWASWDAVGLGGRAGPLPRRSSRVPPCGAGPPATALTLGPGRPEVALRPASGGPRAGPGRGRPLSRGVNRSPAYAVSLHVRECHFRSPHAAAGDLGSECGVVMSTPEVHRVVERVC